jgi:hypothetical protein
MRQEIGEGSAHFTSPLRGLVGCGMFYPQLGLWATVIAGRCAGLTSWNSRGFPPHVKDEPPGQETAFVTLIEDALAEGVNRPLKQFHKIPPADSQPKTDLHRLSSRR